MQSQNPEALRSWFRGVEPLCPELFNAAHAMCGNYDLAEYALNSAILDVWLENPSGGMGFRERLRAALRREALAAAMSDEARSAEFTWTLPPAGGEEDRLLSLLRQELPQTQRHVLLRYGCGLPQKLICQLTDAAPRQLRADLERFEARCRRALPRQQRKRAQALIARRARRLLSQSGPDTPRPLQVYRAFEAEAGGAQAAGGLSRLSRLFGASLIAAAALLCAVAFWLFAVLVQPVGGG